MNVRSITTQPDWGNSPARTRRKSGEIFLNERYLKRNDLTADNWNVYLLHEEGHIALDTRDEFAADDYARKKYLPSGRSLKASVEALTKVLDPNNPVHQQRIAVAMQAAAQWDCEKNKKCSALNLLNGTDTATMEVTSSLEQSLKDTLQDSSVRLSDDASIISLLGYDNATGDVFVPEKLNKCSGGPIKRKRCEETNREIVKQNSAREIEFNREQTSRRETEALLKQQQTEADTARVLATKSIEAQKSTEQTQSKNTMVIVPIIAIVLGVVLLMYFVLKTKKPSA